MATFEHGQGGKNLSVAVIVKVHGNQKLSGGRTPRDSSKLGCSCGIRQSSIITE